MRERNHQNQTWPGKKKKKIQTSVVKATCSVQRAASGFKENHKKPTGSEEKKNLKSSLGSEHRRAEGGGVSPGPSPCFPASLLLPGAVDVGGVGAAVDVAVGLQAVLRRAHHVGGFHRGSGGRRKGRNSAETRWRSRQM